VCQPFEFAPQAASFVEESTNDDFVYVGVDRLAVIDAVPGCVKLDESGLRDVLRLMPVAAQ
jgi:hypothetical protein